MKQSIILRSGTVFVGTPVAKENDGRLKNCLATGQDSQTSGICYNVLSDVCYGKAQCSRTWPLECSKPSGGDL